MLMDRRLVIFFLLPFLLASCMFCMHSSCCIRIFIYRVDTHTDRCTLPDSRYLPPRYLPTELNRGTAFGICGLSQQCELLLLLLLLLRSPYNMDPFLSLSVQVDSYLLWVVFTSRLRDRPFCWQGGWEGRRDRGWRRKRCYWLLP